MPQFQFLLAPAVAMMGLAFLLSAGMRNFYEAKYEQVAFGVLFGCVIVLGMVNPMPIGEGLIFDTRTLLTGAAVAFVGPIAGAIAVGFGIACRIFIGGTGMLAGVIGLVAAYALATAFVHFAGHRIQKPVVKDMLLGIAVTPSLFAFFILPYELAISLFVSLFPAFLLCNVLGIMAIGFIFRRERRYIAEVQDHRVHARTDTLTSLLNRRGMDQEVDSAKFNPSTGHAVFYFDIDNFKFINDHFGHEAGDATLAIVAARIKEVIRDEAVFARHGGDEFSIYVPSLNAEGVQAVADRLCQSVSGQKFSHGETIFAVSISVGGYWTKQNLPLQEMINFADSQLLLAKRAGKNRAQVSFDRQNAAASVA